MVLLNMVAVDTAAYWASETSDAVHCYSTSVVHAVHAHGLVQLLMRMQAQLAAPS